MWQKGRLPDPSLFPTSTSRCRPVSLALVAPLRTTLGPGRRSPPIADTQGQEGRQVTDQIVPEDQSGRFLGTAPLRCDGGTLRHLRETPAEAFVCQAWPRRY